MSIGKSQAANIVYTVLVLLWVMLVLLPISPLNMPYTQRDSGVFLYTGWRILNGELPYRDVWDHKPPVIFYIDALGLALGHDSRWGVWIIEFLFLSVAALIGFRLSRNLFGPLPAAIGTFLWLLTLFFLIQGGNLTTEFALPMQFICLWLVYQSEKQEKLGLRGFLIGAICGVAFFTKQTTIGVGISYIIFLLLNSVINRQFKGLLKKMLIIISGGLAIALIMILVFGSLGILKDFWQAAFVYNFYYSAESIGSHLRAMLFGMIDLSSTGMAYFGLIGWCFGFVWIVFRHATASTDERYLLFGVILLPVEILLTGISGKFNPHYYITLLPVFFLFASLAFKLIIDAMRPDNTKSVTAQTFFTAVILIVIAIIQFKDYHRLILDVRRINYDPQVAYIKSHTSKSDPLLIWGAEAGMLFYTQRLGASRFIYLYPLYMPESFSKPLIEEFLQDIIRTPPPLIINSRDPETPWLSFPTSSDEIRTGLQFLHTHYKFKEMLETWEVYEYVP